jgi:M6 family metalloprotease-like protein
VSALLSASKQFMRSFLGRFETSVDENMHLRFAGRRMLVALIFLMLVPVWSSTVNTQSNRLMAIHDPSATPSMLTAIGHAPQIIPVSGVVRVLVIAVAFSDVNYTLSIAQIKKSWFGTVPAYYREVSFGKLIIQGEVYGWYMLPYPEAHYGKDCHGVDDSDCSGSNQSWHIAVDAVSLAKKDVKFNNYDYFVFLHSGKGEETSHLKDDVWSVTYVDGVSIKTDSKTLTRFSIVPELEEPPYVPNGDWCLEFAHDLGVPDLYDTSKGPNNGKPILGSWELMDKGSWNGDPPGSLPAHMTAWSKIQLGFIGGSTLATVFPGVTSTFTVDPTEIASSNVHAIRVPFTNASNPSQYYLVEVRTETGFDSALPAFGVLITYVDETRPVGPVRIMDGDPSVSDLEDAAWRVGQTFTDSNHNLTMQVNSRTGNSYRITVTNGQHRDAVHSPPVVTSHMSLLSSISTFEPTRLLSAQDHVVRMVDRRRVFLVLSNELAPARGSTLST